MTIGGGAPLTDTFSVGYTGGLASDSGWVQFIWSEVVATQADGSDTHVAATGLGASNGVMGSHDRPQQPRVQGRLGGVGQGSVLRRGLRQHAHRARHDDPRPARGVLRRHRKQFDAGATKVIERDHFDQFLVRDYTTIYHTSLYVEWVYTAKTTVARSTKPGGAR